MKVSELEGAELDCWVAKAEGLAYSHKYLVEPKINKYAEHTLDYHRDWSLSGKIIEREKISLEPYEGLSGWDASISTRIEDDFDEIKMHGSTPLIAAMRCFIASVYGDEVSDE